MPGADGTSAALRLLTDITVSLRRRALHLHHRRSGFNPLIAGRGTAMETEIPKRLTLYRGKRHGALLFVMADIFVAFGRDQGQRRFAELRMAFLLVILGASGEGLDKEAPPLAGGHAGVPVVRAMKDHGAGLEERSP